MVSINQSVVKFLFYIKNSLNPFGKSLYWANEKSMHSKRMKDFWLAVNIQLEE